KGVCDDDDVAARASAAGELERGLDRLRARVAQKHLAAQRAPGQGRREPHRRRGVVQVGGMRENTDLLARPRPPARVAVPNVEHRDPGQKVEVLVAVGVPQPAARAAHELDRVAHIGPDHVLALERLQLRQRRREDLILAGERGGLAHLPGPILVPCPASVNSSSSSECGTRPSTIWAKETPPLIASRQAASLGRIPPATWGSASATSSALASETTLAGSAGSRNQPATSVRNMIL